MHPVSGAGHDASGARWQHWPAHGPGQPSTLATHLDNMIAVGEIDPMIVVTPTFYPDDNASLDRHYAGQLDQIFPLRGNLHARAVAP